MQSGRELGVGCRGHFSYLKRVFRSGSAAPGSRLNGAFTLLEIMMVVAIIGLMMAMGVPAILRTMHQEPLRKAVNDVMNICSHARAQAILHGVTTCVVFHPRSKEVALAAVATTNSPDNFISRNSPDKGGTASAFDGSALNSAQFDESITIDMLDINLTEYKDANEARVRFFPDGTSDEMTLILDSRGQYRKISLEVTTGLASLEVIR